MFALIRKQLSVVEKAIVKMQKKTQRHTRGLGAHFIDFCARLRISTYQLHAGMIFTTLFLPEDKKFSQKVLKTP